MRQRYVQLLALCTALLQTPVVLAGFAPPVFVTLEGAGAQPSTLATGDVNGDGKPDLVTTNFASANVTVLLGDGAGRFTSAPGSPIVVGAGPRSLALHDLDGNGTLDVVTANSCDRSLTILLNQGGGVFGPSQNPPAPIANFYPAVLLVGDVDGDGSVDLVTISGFDSTGRVFRGDGRGGVLNPLAPIPFSLGVDHFRSIAMGDLDGDGRMDLVAAVLNPPAENPHGLEILLATSNGDFAPAVGSPLPLDEYPGDVALSDLDRDGLLDLAFTRRSDNDVVVLLGRGGGTFQPAPGSPLPLLLYADGSGIRVGDTNGDGRPDLVIIESASGRTNVHVYLGESGGGFHLAPDPPGSLPADVSAVVLVDTNGDGVLDLAASDSRSWEVTVLPGTGTGGFGSTPITQITVGAAAASVETGDLDGDGRLDLATANQNNGTVTVLLQPVPGAFVPAPGSPFTVSRSPLFHSVYTGAYLALTSFRDTNRDGHLDLLTIADEPNATRLTVLLGNGKGDFVAAPPTPPFGLARSPNLGDLDGDGIVDLVLEGDGGTYVTLLGNGDGSFSRSIVPPITRETPISGLLPFRLADLTGDGTLDLVEARRNATGSRSDLVILEGDGHGGFTDRGAPRLNVGSYVSSLAIGDVDADGRPDLVASTGYSIVAFLSAPGGGFTAFPASPRNRFNGSIRSLTDFNGDGRLDLLLDADEVDVMLGDGHGRFRQSSVSPIYVPPAYSPCVGRRASLSAAVGDVNGDGRTDIVAANLALSRLTLLHNTSTAPATFVTTTGTPQTIGILTPFDDPLTVRVLDAGGAGVPDVFVTFQAPQTGPGGSFPDGNVVLTNPLGVASAPFIANDAIGSYTVTATLEQFPVPVVTFALTNVQVSLRAIPAIVSRGSAPLLTIASASGRDRGQLVVRATAVPAGVTVANLVNQAGRIRANLVVSCDAPVGSQTITLEVTDGSTTSSTSLPVEITRDVIPPGVSPPDVDTLTINQSTCTVGAGATLASHQSAYPLQYETLRSFLDPPNLRVYDNCTAAPTRLPSQLLGVDLSTETFFPVGTNRIQLRYRDDEQNVGTATAFVRVYRNGDLNLSGTVDSRDVEILGSFLVGNVSAGQAPFVAARLAADVDGNGAMNLIDLLLVASHLAGTLPCLVPE